MSCFENLIGIRGTCGTPGTPTSGLYINDLTGLTIQNVDAAVNNETSTGIKLIQDKMNLAYKLISEEVINGLKGKFKTNLLVENDQVGYYKDNLTTLAADNGYYRGIQVKIEGYPYSELFISSIRLQLQAIATVNVLVIDLITGLTLDTIPVTTTVNGVVEEVINKTYTLNKGRLNLFIGYDASNASYKTGITYKDSCSDCAGGAKYNVRYAYFKGAKIATGASKINSNISSLSSTGGLSISYNIGCSIDTYLCTIANRMALPIWYKTGALIAKEMVHSKRLNGIIALNTQNHAELEAYYENKCNEAVNNLLNGLHLPNDICFECKKRIKHVTAIP